MESCTPKSRLFGNRWLPQTSTRSLSSAPGLISQSYPAFSSPPLGRPTRIAPPDVLPPSPPAEQATSRQNQAGQSAPSMGDRGPRAREQDTTMTLARLES